MKLGSLVAVLLCLGPSLAWPGWASAQIIALEFDATMGSRHDYVSGSASPLDPPVVVPIHVTLDAVASEWYRDAESAVTAFGQPTISSPLQRNLLQNPFGFSNPSAFTLLSRHNYAGADPFQAYQFVNREYAQVYSETQTDNWSYGFELHSPTSPISGDAVNTVGSSVFLDILRAAHLNGTEFYLSVWSYRFTTPPVYGPPVTYTDGFGYSGSAVLSSVRVIPSPGSLWLVGLGLGLVGLFGRRMSWSARAAGSTSRPPTGERETGFIDCHHLKPVHTLPEGHKTRLEDLALVCANYHRMIHSARPWLTLQQLKGLVEANREPL